MQSDTSSYEHHLISLIADEGSGPMTDQDWEIFLSSIEYDLDELVEDDNGKLLAVPRQSNGFFINQPKGEM